jgi:ribonuclease BN (tRNA processing enzyme)
MSNRKQIVPAKIQIYGPVISENKVEMWIVLQMTHTNWSKTLHTIGGGNKYYVTNEIFLGHSVGLCTYLSDPIIYLKSEKIDLFQ